MLVSNALCRSGVQAASERAVEAVLQAEQTLQQSSGPNALAKQQVLQLLEQAANAAKVPSACQ